MLYNQTRWSDGQNGTPAQLLFGAWVGLVQSRVFFKHICFRLLKYTDACSEGHSIFVFVLHIYFWKLLMADLQVLDMKKSTGLMRNPLNWRSPVLFSVVCRFVSQLWIILEIHGVSTTCCLQRLPRKSCSWTILSQLAPLATIGCVSIVGEKFAAGWKEAAQPSSSHILLLVMASQDVTAAYGSAATA